MNDGRSKLALASEKVIIMSNQLTVEQQRKIEENRRMALERRAQRLGQTNSISKQSSLGCNSTSVNVFQPPKQTALPPPAALIHHKDTSGSASAPKRFVPPFTKDSQSFDTQTKNPKSQLLPVSVNQNTLHNSTSSKQVRHHEHV